ncbi:preprotein translocase, SecA subunit [Thermocrinis albus DSM 14484]|uniref:Protein translocase subunit SecA n=1 Tax=Thermocrinis albus (strain DSM 14484 / JCM 11386 / HI 11/12) TaxID=638303 RepID=D3SNW0_THEAH|nr:preprotein translocase subunit SecA [Thermocrinis albus]ADC88847.1 preprotein translocase, SecA subunit [Thermocrinis albus DSM 14484]
MLSWIIRKILGTKNEREVKRLKRFVEEITKKEKELDPLTNREIRQLAQDLYTKVLNDEELREDITRGKIREEVLLAFAIVREAGKRTLGLRFFDVQLLGGLVLHEGKIAEMKTGEGKTLVATSSAFVNALTDRGVHVVTVNDYLARRDAQWMGPIYKFLGLKVGVINSDYSSYLVEWVDEELAQRAIEENLRVWPAGYTEEVLPSHLASVEAKKAFFTKLVPTTRREAYEAHITYGTNNEFGFDYLRDNMAFSLEEIVQVKGHHYAIVDEVDSILIDEARTPLIISGPAEMDTEIYYTADRVVRKLVKDEDFTVDEKHRTVHLTESGIKKLEQLLGVENLYDIRHIDLLHAIHQAIRAHHLFKRDVHYIVRDNQVLIVDEFTGRVLPGRRWSDGLHQAIEVKEGVPIQQENQTLASITFQNYFRLYTKLAGMTGTAETEALEFKEIYGLDVVVVPTHRPMRRIDHPDLVFKTKKEKWKAVVDIIKQEHAKGRPILVGTISIEDSEHLSQLLQKEGIPHNVLNAKHHEKEAQIIAQAGRLGAVTISTNMAGRGTDILLGGNPEYLAREILIKRGKDPQEASQEEWKEALEEAYRITEEEKKKVVELGGLLVIGTERHESRRIDNQLRGRAGRQGDPGESRFVLSLEDDLMRIFGGDRVKKLMEVLKIPEGEPIESRMVTKAIENAQKRLEAQNFQIRKRLLEYDNVMNTQRMAVYAMRRDILEGKGLEEYLEEFVRDVLSERVKEFLQEDDPELWDTKSLEEYLRDLTGEEINLPTVRDREELVELVVKKVMETLSKKKEELGEELYQQVLKIVMLSTLDHLWREHLHILDRLREGIYLRGYAAKDPLVEYKKESFYLFEDMMRNFKERVLGDVLRLQVRSPEELEEEIQREEEEKEELLKKAVYLAPQEKADQKGPKRKTLKERLQSRRKKT